jgi:hypothetical protein
MKRDGMAAHQHELGAIVRELDEEVAEVVR